MPAERPFLLPDVEITARHLPVGLPDENRARRVASIEGIEQVSHARSGPDVPPLHLWEAQIAVLDHVNEFADRGVNFGHSARSAMLVRQMLRHARRVVNPQ